MKIKHYLLTPMLVVSMAVLSEKSFAFDFKFSSNETILLNEEFDEKGKWNLPQALSIESGYLAFNTTNADFQTASLNLLDLGINLNPSNGPINFYWSGMFPQNAKREQNAYIPALEYADNPPVCWNGKGNEMARVFLAIEDSSCEELELPARITFDWETSSAAFHLAEFFDATAGTPLKGTGFFDYNPNVSFLGDESNEIDPDDVLSNIFPGALDLTLISNGKKATFNSRTPEVNRGEVSSGLDFFLPEENSNESLSYSASGAFGNTSFSSLSEGLITIASIDFEISGANTKCGQPTVSPPLLPPAECLALNTIQDLGQETQVSGFIDTFQDFAGNCPECGITELSFSSLKLEKFQKVDENAELRAWLRPNAFTRLYADPDFTPGVEPEQRDSSEFPFVTLDSQPNSQTEYRMRIQEKNQKVEVELFFLNNDEWKSLGESLVVDSSQWRYVIDQKVEEEANYLYGIEDPLSFESINIFLRNDRGNPDLNATTKIDAIALTQESVPEPTSILSFLALGTLGAASIKRKLKPSKSIDKEVEKAS
ncbi:PEP-CTERM sorting domain-containing protein [Okeania sp. SIO2C2]|uniref:PEP-CTERM sorting domain-containing protein n=1 Tax=Okeania sp. SIO2C2 TaxID=2607787 RepID=UPI00257BE88E|nr:PEP-CTERM sorting domain-containing protein [Okeania sp. SIO2C2]